MENKRQFKAPWIEITTVFPCSNMCSYCPQKLLMESYKGTNKLSFKDFKKVLKNVSKDVIIDFAGFSEPFLNDEAADMMVYAHDQGYGVAVWSTLVGLREDDIEKIKDIPFIKFSCHDIGQKRQDLPFIDDWHKAKPNSRGGNLWEEKRKQVVSGCSMGNGFTHNVMMPNGDVVLCCSDYGMKHKLGNLLETNFNDLKRGCDYELCYFCEYAL